MKPSKRDIKRRRPFRSLLRKQSLPFGLRKRTTQGKSDCFCGGRNLLFPRFRSLSLTLTNIQHAPGNNLSSVHLATRWNFRWLIVGYFLAKYLLRTTMKLWFANGSSNTIFILILLNININISLIIICYRCLGYVFFNHFLFSFSLKMKNL